jgi:hypothetical protein
VGQRKVIVFTYDRVKSATTSLALEAAGIEHTVVCHDEDHLRQFVENGVVRQERIIASGAPKGLANNRNWVIENLMDDGEWALFLVDDWMWVEELEGYEQESRRRLPITVKNSGEWGARFRHKVQFQTFMLRVEEAIAKAEEVGCSLAGFAAYDNPLFRAEHWRRNVFVDGRALIVQKTWLRFDPNVQMIDDFCFTAQNIMSLNGTVVNEWVLPKCGRYTKGSYGSMEERMPQKMRECAYLVRAYPGVVKIADKAGWPHGSHVRIIPAKGGRLNKLMNEAAAMGEL